jgi:hypothetical protein
MGIEAVAACAAALVNDCFSSSSSTLTWKQTTSGVNASGTLTVKEGTSSTTLTLVGSYTVPNFSATSDGHGGTLITDPPITGGAVVTSSGTGSGSEGIAGAPGPISAPAWTVMVPPSSPIRRHRVQWFRRRWSYIIPDAIGPAAAQRRAVWDWAQGGSCCHKTTHGPSSTWRGRWRA